MKRIVFASLAFTPGIALAQVPTNPGLPTAPADAPTNLNPSLPGNQGPPPATPPAAQRPQRQPVIVVGPDGTVKQVDAPDPGPGGYYIGGGDTYTEPTVIHSGPTPELHVVRSGDTLWDICWYYFNDPWQWPKVWSYNAQITNPHWIYPGDLVRLLPRGTFVGQPDPEPDRRVDPVPAPQRRIESSVTTTAFVERPELDTAIVIDGAVDQKTLLGTGDEVYLSYSEKNPPQVGKKYSIYIPGREVKYNQKNFGSYVRLQGTLEVVSSRQDKRARGRILEANMEIERGAKVGPLITKFRNVPPVPPKVDLQSTIVAMLTKDQLIGEKGEVVFIAAGKGSGVEIGNRMYVVRRGDAKPNNMDDNIGSDDRRFPARALGEIVVVEVGKTISVGVVTLSVQEMSIGDIVMMQRQAAP